MNLLQYFTDPILRAPTIGCMLLCIAASMMGVILFLQKRLMISESMSHAAYPGAVLGILALAWVGGPGYESYSFLAVLAGAFLSAWVSLRAMLYLERKLAIRSDSAQCFALSLFFGVGILLASFLQETHPMWIQQSQMLLFGQVATLSDEHIYIYGALALLCLFFIFLSFRSLQSFLFDPGYSKFIGVRVKSVRRILHWLLLLSIIVGIRSVGVILMSGMLIAPAVAARQFSNQLKTIFFLSAVFGALSGLLGNIFSVELSRTADHVHIPTGPMIVLVSTFFALSTLLFAPKRGVLFRLARLALFRVKCLEENALKYIWKKGMVEKSQLKDFLGRHFRFIAFCLLRHGWVQKENAHFILTEDGRRKAASIVRLHRLWELYLTEQLRLNKERVHQNAEEMEHVLTPELEEKLTSLLSNPEQDPHEQPIPRRAPFL